MRPKLCLRDLDINLGSAHTCHIHFRDLRQCLQIIPGLFRERAQGLFRGITIEHQVNHLVAVAYQADRRPFSLLRECYDAVHSVFDIGHDPVLIRIFHQFDQDTTHALVCR